MRIGNIQAALTYDMPVRDPVTWVEMTGNGGKPFFVTLSYPESTPEFKAIKMRARNETLSGRKKETAEREDARLLDLIASCIKGWYLEDEECKPIAYSQKVARAILDDDQDGQPSWIKEQIVIAIGDKSNFFSSGSKAA
jgi:hypothetical protein